MHIAFIAPHHISKYTGGQERYAHELALGLHQDGHQVSYICAAADKSSAPYSIFPLPHYSLGHHILPTKAWLDKLINLNPDIIHITLHTLPYILFSRLIKTKLNSKIIIMYLAPSSSKNYLSKFVLNFSESLLTKSFDAVTTLSPQHTSQLQTIYPNLSVHTLTPSLPTEFFSLSPKTKNVMVNADKTNLLFVGTLDQHHYYKGLDTLLKAMAITDPKYHLHIVGGGDRKLEFQKIISQHKLSSRVSFHGYLPTSQLKELYQQVDICIMPSSTNSEGFGIVLLESLSQGTPVITTHVAGASSLLKNKSFACIIPANHSQKLARSISTINKKSKPNKDAITFARKFTPQNLSKKAVKYYQEILNHD